MLNILEAQSLETGGTYKKTEYGCKSQGNYTLFYKDKLYQNKQAEIGKKYKQTKKTFRIVDLNTENITLTVIHILFENMLTKR